MKSQHDFPNVNAKRAQGMRPGGKPFRVMVVDDKEFQRKQLIQIFESEGYEVIASAENGQEALKLYERHGKNLDLITTDLDMPLVDGYALLFELMQKQSKVKVVFISDDTSKTVLADLLKMGAADFILKPIQRGRILERIRMVLDKASASE